MPILAVAKPLARDPRDRRRSRAGASHEHGANHDTGTEEGRDPREDLAHPLVAIDCRAAKVIPSAWATTKCSSDSRTPRLRGLRLRNAMKPGARSSPCSDSATATGTARLRRLVADACSGLFCALDHGHLAGVEIDVFPLKGGDLALPQAAEARQHHRNRQSVPAEGLHQFSSLLRYRG